MKTLFFIDANSLIYRCFFALPPLTGAGGKPAGALYGLSNILLKIFKEQRPDYAAAFFDRPEPTFRKKMFVDYKIHRPKAPDELVSQIIEARRLFDSFGVKTFEAAGFEGDDLIGTAVEKFKNLPELKIVMLSGDLDNLQLVENDKVVEETFKKGISETAIYDESGVEKRFGVLPKQMPDYKSLVGDASDNIPGVPGVGPKTAAVIIQKYGCLENFFEKGTAEKVYGKIFPLKDQVFLSRQLATIRRDAPLPVDDVEELKHDGLDPQKLISYFKKLGFKSLANRMTP